MHVPKDLMWQRILKKIWFLGELNKALIKSLFVGLKSYGWKYGLLIYY